jgi:hypothetical protein
VGLGRRLVGAVHRVGCWNILKLVASLLRHMKEVECVCARTAQRQISPTNTPVNSRKYIISMPLNQMSIQSSHFQVRHKCTLSISRYPVYHKLLVPAAAARCSDICTAESRLLRLSMEECKQIPAT